jgi:uncharacterized damage-inducible protein DinB
METKTKSLSPVVAASNNMLNSIKSLLENLPNEIYVKPDNILSGASLGQHFRHIIEFYQCIVDVNENRLICYDNRKRDLRLEESIDFMNLKIGEISDSISKLNPQTEIQTLSKFTSDPQEKKIKINSSIGRELAYGFDHSIHHLAIIKIAMDINHPEIELPDGLGVAPSTLQYRETCVR